MIRTHKILHRTAIGHDESLKAPLATKNVGEHHLVLGVRHAINAVVRGHDG